MMNLSGQIKLVRNLGASIPFLDWGAPSIGSSDTGSSFLTGNGLPVFTECHAPERGREPHLERLQVRMVDLQAPPDGLAHAFIDEVLPAWTWCSFTTR